MNIRMAALVAAACTVFPFAAEASQVQSIPDATFRGTILDSFYHPNVIASETVAGTISDTLSHVTLGIQPSAFVDVGASGVSLDPGLQRVTEGQVTYFAELIGPANQLVPLHLLVNLMSSYSSNSRSGADVGVYINSGFLARKFVASGSGQDLSQHNYFGSIDFSMMVGSHLSIVVTGYAEALGGAGEAHAFADPLLTIDPSAGDAFSLAFSPGVGNAVSGPGGVPEPSTWALMLVGFGGLGAMLRRRRGHAVLAV
jgi:hypothetical protein